MAAASTWQSVGPYRGLLDDGVRRSEWTDRLAELPAHLDTAASRLLQGGRHQTFRIALACGDQTLDLVVKRFGRQTAFKDLWDRAGGTQAARTFRAADFLARHGIGTTRPVAALERWEGRRLAECYFVSAYLEHAVSFKDILLHAFGTGVEASDILRVLRLVADAIRRMHDAGCLHRDLGNQNILICGWDHAAPEAQAVAFLDLNRARCGRPLSRLARARDLSRITLPSALLWRFIGYYWRQDPPRAFWLQEQALRHAFALHTFTRFVRHPIREWRYRLRRGSPDAPQHALYPGCREYWIWDASKHEPLPAVTPFGRWLCRPPLRGVYRGLVNGSAGLSVARARRRLRRGVFAQPVDFGPNLAVAWRESRGVRTEDADAWRELGVRQCVLAFYQHEDDGRLQARLETALALGRGGCRLAAALVQSRAAIRDPEGWNRFCTKVIETLNPHLDWVGVGHAVDEVRWGVWGFDDYRRLVAGLANLTSCAPHVQWVTPSLALARAADVLPDLRQLPRPHKSDAVLLRLSDADIRLPADELAARLARVRARARQAGTEGLVLTGLAHGAARIRVLMTALASGLARTCVLESGADGSGPDEALCYWLHHLGAGRFIARLPTHHPGAVLLQCSTAAGRRVLVGWTQSGVANAALPFAIGAVHDVTGRPRPLPSGETLTLGSEPSYAWAQS